MSWINVSVLATRFPGTYGRSKITLCVNSQTCWDWTGKLQLRPINERKYVSNPLIGSSMTYDLSDTWMWAAGSIKFPTSSIRGNDSSALKYLCRIFQLQLRSKIKKRMEMCYCPNMFLLVTYETHLVIRTEVSRYFRFTRFLYWSCHKIWQKLQRRQLTEYWISEVVD